jgi:glycosyltransferase involved in cell wall biosynthesis
MAARVKIGIVDLSSIEDRSASSGVPFSVAAALNKWCGEVVELGPFPPSDHCPLRHRLCNQAAWTLTGRTLYWPYSRPCIVDWARRIQDSVQRSSCDVVFTAERSRWAVALLRIAQPIVVFTDSTMRSIRNMGGYFTDGLPGLQVARAIRIERTLYRRAAAILVASTWALDSIVNDYGISPDRVILAPFGANLLQNEAPTGEGACRIGSSDECRLLWVGDHWSRKGGDQAILIRDELERFGINAHLTLIGSNKGPSIENPRVRVVGPLHKGNPDEARRFWEFFRMADFYILPSRAETFGIGCAEASAFGLPTIAPALGGIPEVVRNGVNGILVAPHATPAEFAQRIAELHGNPEQYRRLSEGARKLFLTVFNWDVWGQRTNQVLTSLRQGSPREQLQIG